MVESKYLPGPSLKERDRRWREIRERMSIRGLDCLVVWASSNHRGAKGANTRYLTRIGNPIEDSVVVFPIDSEPTAIVYHPTTAGWYAKSQDWVQDVRGRKGEGRSGLGFAEATVERLKELQIGRGSSIGILGIRDIPYFQYLALTKSFPETSFVFADDLLEEVRMIKSAEELTFMEKAGKLVDVMFEAQLKTAKVGVKEIDVCNNMINAMISNGGELPTMLLWEAAQEPEPHAGRYAGDRPLKMNDIIIVELHSRYAGYLGHGEWSMSIGQPRQEFKDIFEVIRQSYNACLGALKPGSSLANISEAMYKPVLEAGMGVTELGIHAHGMDSGEFPTFLGFPFHYAGSDKPKPFTLRENMIIAPTVDLVNPKWKGGKTGLMFSDTLHITSNGPRRLCNHPVELVSI